MPPRIFVAQPLHADPAFDLPAPAARHVQVLRLQPGAALTLFDGSGGQWQAQVVRVERRLVQVHVLQHDAVERESTITATLAVAMPANERMDALVEKATELGAAAIQPLLAERSVLRLSGERAAKRRDHWQAIAAAACEQCGRNRLPAILPVQPLATWLDGLAPAAPDEARLLLAWHEARPWAARPRAARLTLLSGPEGGFSAAEEQAAQARGFVSVWLGPRVLRADTAPLAALAALTLAG